MHIFIHTHRRGEHDVVAKGRPADDPAVLHTGQQEGVEVKVQKEVAFEVGLQARPARGQAGAPGREEEREGAATGARSQPRLRTTQEDGPI